MTTIEREVTREEARNKTVSTCDVCGVAEVDMPDNESIIDMKCGESREVEYHIEYWDKDSVGMSEKVFDSFNEARDWSWRYTFDNTNRVNKETHVTYEYEFDIDICEHCVETLFGANENLSQTAVSDDRKGGLTSINRR
jgi:hypothetical protein